jgi:hypothetical protein
MATISDINSAIDTIGSAVAPLSQLAQCAKTMPAALSGVATNAARTTAGMGKDTVAAVKRELDVLRSRGLDVAHHAAVLGSLGSGLGKSIDGLGHFVAIGHATLARLVSKPGRAQPSSTSYGADLAGAVTELGAAYATLTRFLQQRGDAPALPPIDTALRAAAAVLAHTPAAVLAAFETVVPIATVRALSEHLASVAGGPTPASLRAVHAAAGGTEIPDLLDNAARLAGLLESGCSLLQKTVTSKLSASVGGKASGDVGVTGGWAAALSAKIGITVIGEGGLRVTVTPVDLTGGLFAVVKLVFGLVKIGAGAAAKVLRE